MTKWFNDEQIERLYDEFEFDEEETITSACLENGELKIYYDDEEGYGGCYIPSKIEKERMNYILKGIRY